MPSWIERPLPIFLGLLLLTMLMLSANWSEPFYKFDDQMHIKWGTEVGWAQTWDFRRDVTYFPVSLLSLRLDRALFGTPFTGNTTSGALPVQHEAVTQNDMDFDAPAQGEGWAAGVRVMSGLYHALAGLVLWFLLRRIGAGAGLAALVALVWTGHPMACESVCWISERKNVLAALFGFGALLTWTAPWRCWRWPLVYFLYVLACLSKPTAVGFLPILAAMEFLLPFPRRLTDGEMERRGDGEIWIRGVPPVSPSPCLPVCPTSLSTRARGVAALLPLAAVTAGVIVIGLHADAQNLTEAAGGSRWTALLTDAEIFPHYVFNILLPVNLSFFYGIVPIVSLADPRVWLYGLPLAAFFIASVALTAGVKRRLALFGAVWFFGALGPTSNIVTLPYWMQDRYAYFSAAGLLLTAGLLIEELFAHDGVPLAA